MRLKSVDTFVRNYLESPKITVVTVSSDHRYEKNYHVDERKEIHLAEFIYAARMLSTEVLIPEYIVNEQEHRKYINTLTLEYDLSHAKLKGFAAISKTGRLETVEEALFAAAHAPFASGRSGYPFITVADAVKTFKNASDYHTWAFSLSATVDELASYTATAASKIPDLPSGNALPRMNPTTTDESAADAKWKEWLEYPDDLQDTIQIILTPYSRHLLLRKYGFLGSQLADPDGEKYVFGSLEESFSKLPDTDLKRDQVSRKWTPVLK